jgi:hypothetical protein
VAIGGELATPSWPSMEVSPDENPIPPFPGRAVVTLRWMFMSVTSAYCTVHGHSSDVTNSTPFLIWHTLEIF